MNKFTKFLMKLVRNRLESSSEGKDYQEDMLKKFDEGYPEVESSTADAFDKFGEKLKTGWNKFTDGLDNWWKGFTGSGLTKRDILLNEMNMQNVEDTAARQVAGYNNAGVNPALMYGSGGQQSAPQSSATGGSGSLSDLMQVLLLPKQMKMMDAQTKNIEASSEKTLADTEQVKLALKFYPSLTEKTIAEIGSRIDLNAQNISESQAREEVAKFEALIKKTESQYADVYFDLRNQGEAAKRDAALESAAESMARAAWTQFETQWTKDHNGARPSSSSLLALVEALATFFGAESNQKQQGIIVRAVEKVTNPQTYQKHIKLPPKTDRSKASNRAYMRARRAITGRGLVLD